MDAPTTTILQNNLRQESRSFLHYVAESFPWPTLTAGEAARLAPLFAEERKALAAYSRYLDRRRLGVLYLGSYPFAFTTMNFITYDNLLPRLLEDQQQRAAALERDLTALTDADAKAPVRALLDAKLRTVKALEQLLAASAQPAAT